MTGLSKIRDAEQFLAHDLPELRVYCSSAVDERPVEITKIMKI